MPRGVFSCILPHFLPGAEGAAEFFCIFSEKNKKNVVFIPKL